MRYISDLVGVFIMGILVAAIIDQGATNRTNLGILGNFGFIVLLVSFLLSLAGMIYIRYTGVGQRKKKLNSVMKLFQDYLKIPKNQLTNDKIMELEGKIADLFPFEV
jgi:hypothetical protein